MTSKKNVSLVECISQHSTPVVERMLVQCTGTKICSSSLSQRRKFEDNKGIIRDCKS